MKFGDLKNISHSTVQQNTSKEEKGFVIVEDVEFLVGPSKSTKKNNCFYE